MDEKLKILEMIESGKISAKEGLDLLKALEGETHTEVKDPAPLRFNKEVFEDSRKKRSGRR